ncbi:MAG: molybdopterin molybdotransferase MoeA [Flavobacteriaceae bacterium]
MITYESALAVIQGHKVDLRIESKALEQCTGRYLAEDLVADRDFPPFDRVTMDGIAIAFSSFQEGKRAFALEATAAAGAPQCHMKNKLNCLEVMTGAVLPKETDTVIRYEDLSIENGIATLSIAAVTKGQNIHKRGIDLPKGSCIVKKGCRISSAEINIAATIGKSYLKVSQMPKTVVVSTGDELVDVDKIPMPHQIRRSNSYGIQNTLREWGIQAELAHLPDDRATMLQSIPQLLEKFELLIFSGGVSKGKYDYLPEVLETVGVKKHFHKVSQRPGKPFWFGTHDTKSLFALPGNPVSSFICLYVYVQSWLQASLGIRLETTYAILGREVTFSPKLTYFLEAKIESDPKGALYARPIVGNGSGDFANLVNTDGFLVLPDNKTVFRAGEAYPFIQYRDRGQL